MDNMTDIPFLGFVEASAEQPDIESNRELFMNQEVFRGKLDNMTPLLGFTEARSGGTCGPGSSFSAFGFLSFLLITFNFSANIIASVNSNSNANNNNNNNDNNNNNINMNMNMGRRLGFEGRPYFKM